MRATERRVTVRARGRERVCFNSYFVVLTLRQQRRHAGHEAGAPLRLREVDVTRGQQPPRRVACVPRTLRGCRVLLVGVDERGADLVQVGGRADHDGRRCGGWGLRAAVVVCRL